MIDFHGKIMAVVQDTYKVVGAEIEYWRLDIVIRNIHHALLTLVVLF